MSNGLVLSKKASRNEIADGSLNWDGLLHREFGKMKTAVVCWSLFSITFAFPIAQPPPAGALKKLEIEKEFYSSDGNDDKAQKEDPHLVSSDAKAREESFSSDGSDDKAQKEFYSSDGNDDKAQKEDPHLLSSDAKAREGGLSDQVKGEEATKEETFSSDGSDDKAQKEFYSSDGNDDKAQKEGSHFVNSDAKARAGSLSDQVKGEEATKEETFSSDGSDDKAQKDAVDVPVQHAEAQSSADHLEYRQLERRAFSTLNSHFVESRDSNNYEEDFISPTASDDNNQQEISYALDDNDNAFKFVNERAFDDGYAGNDAEVGAEAEFVNDSLENVLASVDTENPDTPTPVA
nr:PREDICTED: dentin sialophosphoprotein isoform X2 [Anolis carolinensis]|eukprot:XP_008109233.1 PREDICTED: dentin sialophosphoprotein isoform X2 [Anolis carolinensis]